MTTNNRCRGSSGYLNNKVIHSYWKPWSTRQVMIKNLSKCCDFGWFFSFLVKFDQIISLKHIKSSFFYLNWIIMLAIIILLSGLNKQYSFKSNKWNLNGFFEEKLQISLETFLKLLHLTKLFSQSRFHHHGSYQEWLLISFQPPDDSMQRFFSVKIGKRAFYLLK